MSDIAQDLADLELTLAKWDSNGKSCNICGEDDVEKLATIRSKGKLYMRSLCKPCKNRNAQRWASGVPNYNERRSKRNTEKRQLAEYLPQTILTDSRGWDRKKGFENDLTKDFIAEKISRGCQYCGGSEIRMTLDRKDNSRGHTQDNVVPACIRCNYVRRDMPYDAWLNMVPYVKKAFDQNLFGIWTGRARSC